MNHPRAHVAVIGAGWAGLAAAVTLAGRGMQVTLFEASRTPGGRARQVEIEGIALDNGQHLLLGAYRDTLRCMRAVGADPAALFVRMRLELRVAPDFRLRAPFLPAPLHGAAALLTARGLGWGERLAAMRFARAIARDRYRLAADTTVAALLDEHRQHGALRACLWEPLCIAALNTPIARASAQVFLNVIRDSLGGARSASDLLLPRADLGRLFPLPATDWLRRHGTSVRLGAQVRRITCAPQGFTLDAEAATYSHVIIATAPQHALALVEPFAALASVHAQLARFAYEPIYTCYLAYERARLPFPMVGLRDGMVQWAFDRGALGGHTGLLAAVVSASGPHEALGLAEFADGCDAELRAAFGDLGRLRWARTIAEKRATYSCTPALSRPRNATPLPALLLAGDYTASDHPGTLEGAVRSGCAAAALVGD